MDIVEKQKSLEGQTGMPLKVVQIDTTKHQFAIVGKNYLASVLIDSVLYRGVAAIDFNHAYDMSGESANLTLLVNEDEFRMSTIHAQDIIAESEKLANQTAARE